MVDGSVEEEQLWKCFRDVQPFGPAAGRAVASGHGQGSAPRAGAGREGQGEERAPAREEGESAAGAEKRNSKKPKVPKLGLRLFACNLSGVDLASTRDWSAPRWRQLYARAPWRAFYTDYVVPLAKLSRALSATYAARTDDDRLRDLACR